jgi:hypothetical protein
VGQDYPWYRRDIVAGPVKFRLDVWPADPDGKEWAGSFNGLNADRFTQPTAERAMASAETQLDVHLKSLRRQLKRNETQAKARTLRP